MLNLGSSFFIEFFHPCPLKGQHNFGTDTLCEKQFGLVAILYTHYAILPLALFIPKIIVFIDKI